MKLQTKSPLKIPHPFAPEESTETSKNSLPGKNSSSKQPGIRLLHFTKQPRDMVECFMKVTSSAPEDYLKRFGRKADIKALMNTHFLPQETATSKTCNDSRKDSKPRDTARKTKAIFKNKSTDYSYITRPILIERHSSDEELNSAPKNSKNQTRRSKNLNSVQLVTLRRAKYRKQMEREKKRLDDIKKEFEVMANEEARLKKVKRLTQHPKPNIRKTRTYTLRARAIFAKETGVKYNALLDNKTNSSETKTSGSSESETFVSTSKMVNSRFSKRRNCVFRIRRTPAESSSRSKNTKRSRTTGAASRSPYHSPFLNGRDSNRRGDMFVHRPLAYKACKGKRPRFCTVPVHNSTRMHDGCVGNFTSDLSAEKESRFWHQRLINWRVNSGGNLPPFK